jgi:hypothetical protein
MQALPSFRLVDRAGTPRAFPSGRPTLLVFAKADCPTCVLTLPVLEQAHRALGDAADVWLVAQDADHGAALASKASLTLPILDDGALGASRAYGLEIVPTTVWADADGNEQQRLEGFGRNDWRALLGAFARRCGHRTPELAWDELPEWRPGCGSRSLEAQTGARRHALADDVDPVEFLFEQGWTDGLPVVPPTPERVRAMLGGTRRDPAEVVAVVPPNLAPATVEKIAVNAVMAGCKPEYLPVVLAAVEAACDEAFNLHGVLATTYFVGPIVVVNGPVRKRLGINDGINALGQGHRANATIGRALQLVVRNLGGGRPGEVDRATLGQPGKYTCCFAEREERSPWEPFHVERGFAPSDSTVTVYAGGAPTGFIDQIARDAEALATTYGLVLAGMGHPKHPLAGETLVVVPPEHADVFARDGWTKARVRERILEIATRPARELAQDAFCAEGLPPMFAERIPPETPLPKFRGPEMVKLVVAGGDAGKFGAYFQSWPVHPFGSDMVTRRIGD